MTQHLDRPVVCPVLVGRAPHLAALERSLSELDENRGQTLLVAGEAGVGKSRLVAAARERAAGRGVTVLEGRCFESHRAAPYAPLVDLLGAAAPKLDRPEQEKHQLFRDLADAVFRVAGRGPALVVVEDVHWSDDASLDFLADLARQVATRPVLLLVTYRDDELSPALSKLLAALDRQRLAAELRLRRLGRAGVGEMLRAISGRVRPPRPGFVDEMFALTDGNPFFVEEAVRSLVAAGAAELSGLGDHATIGRLPVPRTVRDAVQRRAAELSDAARQLLEVAAVVGQRFDVELLGAVTGWDELEIVRSIKELLAAGMVVEESAERFGFRHTLTREAISAGLLARERRALHQAIAEAIARVRGSSPAALDAHAADLARHYYEAEVWEKALLLGRRAGERALALFAPRAAAEHFTRAIEAGRRLGQEPPPELLRARGQAYETLGEFEPARADLEATLARARDVGDQTAEWQALLDLGAAWTGRSYERGGEYYRSALALARELSERDPHPLAHTLNSVGNWHTNLERPAEAVQHHHEALALFRAADDRRGVAETLDYLGMATYLAADLIAARTHLDQAIVLLRELDHRRGLSSALATRAIATGGGHFADLMALPTIDPGAPREDAEAALDVAPDIGWRAGEAYALGCVANLRYVSPKPLADTQRRLGS